MGRGWCPLSRHVAGLRDRERTVVQWLARHRMSLLEDASLEMPWVCEKRRPPVGLDSGLSGFLCLGFIWK